MASSQAANRLRIEYATLQKTTPNPQIHIKPNMDNMLEWHYCLHKLPSDTPYHGGYYWGKLVFPPNYPFAPPSIIMLTDSGRFTPNMRLCLSMSDYHPESWNPSWRAETILVGLLSFMTDPADPATAGGMQASKERRAELAAKSLKSNAAHPTFRTLFPELVELSEKQAKEEASSSAATKSPVDDNVAPPARKKLKVETKEEGKGAAAAVEEEARPAPKAKAKAKAKARRKSGGEGEEKDTHTHTPGDTAEPANGEKKPKAKARRKGTKSETPSPEETHGGDEGGGDTRRGRKRGTAELEAPVAKGKAKAGGKKK